MSNGIDPSKLKKKSKQSKGIDPSKLKKKDAVTPSEPLVTTGALNGGEKNDPVSNVNNARQVPLTKLKKDLEFYRGFYGEDLGNPAKNKQYNELVDVYQERLKETPITEAPIPEKVQSYRQNAFLDIVEQYQTEGLISEEVASKASQNPEAVYDAIIQAKKEVKSVSERGGELPDMAPEPVDEDSSAVSPPQEEETLPEFVQDPSSRRDETEVDLTPEALTEEEAAPMEERAAKDAKKELNQNISANITRQIENDLPETMSKKEYEKLEESLKSEGIRVDLSGEGVVGEDVGFATSALNTFNQSIENIALSAANYAMDAVPGVGAKGFDAFRKSRLEAYEKNITDYEKSASEALMEGDVGAAMENSLMTLTESAPLMLAAAGVAIVTKNPLAAVATMSALSAAQTYSDVENEDWYKNLPALGKTAYLFTQGTAEGYGGMASARIFTKAFKNAVISGVGAKGIKKTFRPFLEATGKNMGVAASEEALAESATGGIQYVNERIAKGEPVKFNDLVSTIQESAVQGMVGGTAIAGAGAAPVGAKIAAKKGVNTAIAATKTLKVKKADYEIDKLYKSIKKTDNIDERRILQERAIRRIQERAQIYRNEKERIEEMPEEQRQEYLDALFSIERLNRKLRKVDPESDAGKVVMEEMKPHEETIERIDKEVANKKAENQQDQTQEQEEEVQDEENLDISEDELAALEEEIEIETEAETKNNIQNNLDEKVYRDGKEGMLKIDDENKNTVVFETNDEIIEIGSLDEVQNQSIDSYGLSLMPPEGVDVTKKGQDSDVITLEGVEYEFLGRRRDKKGEAVVRLKEVDTGLERRVKGEKAERILKDQALKKPKDKPKTKLKEEGKEVGLKSKQKKQKAKEKQKELEEMSFAELQAAQEKAEKEVIELEEELSKEAVKQSKVNRLVFPLGEKQYAVRKKPDGSYSVSQKNANGRFVGIKDKQARENATKEYESLKEQKESEALEQAQELAEDFRKEQEDKVLSLLDDLIEKTSNKGRAFDATLGIPMFLANSSFKVVKAAYKAGKTLNNAIQDGIKYIKDQGYEVNETEYKKFILSESKKEKKYGIQKDTEEKQSVPEGVQTRGNETQEREKGSELRAEEKEVISKLKTVAQAYKTGKADTKKEITGFAKEVSSALKGFKKGVVSATKAKTIANKAANIKTEKQLDNFISYAKKVMQKASYEQDLKEVKQKQKRAKTRRKKGDLGTDAGQTRDALKITPSNLELDDFERYDNMVRTMAKPGYKRENVSKDISYFAKMYRDGAKEKSKDKSVPKNEPKKETPFRKKTIDEVLTKQKDKKVDFNYRYESEYNVLMSLTKDELSKLNDNQLQEVSTAIDNIEEGFDPSHTATEVTADVEAERKNKTFEGAVKDKVFNGLLRDVFPRLLKGNTKADTRKRMVRYIKNTPLNRIDTIFKGQKGNTIYKTFVRPISSAYSSFKGAMNSIEQDYNSLYKKIKDKKTFDIKATFIALAKQKEFNPENPELGTVKDYIGAIDEAGIQNNDYRPLAQEYKSVYGNMLEEDGSFDWRKQYDKLSVAEKRAFDFAEETFADNAEMVRAGATRNGDATVVYEYYTPLKVMFDTTTKLDDVLKEAEKFVGGEPSNVGKAQNFKERTKGAKPIYLSFSENFLRSSRQTLQDYHLRRPMRVFAKAIGKIKKNDEVDATGRDFAMAINSAMKKATQNTFINDHYEMEGSWEKIMNYLVKRGYQGALASAPRMGAEFTSNALYALTYAPDEFLKGSNLVIGSRRKEGDFKEFRELTRLAQSTQFSRLWQSEGGLMEEQGATQNGVVPFAGDRLKKLDKGIDRINNAVVSAPDRAIAVPIWTGTFAKTFEKQAGVKLDVDKFNNDASYREKHREAVEAATMEADRKLSQGFATMNPFEGIVAAQVTKTDGWFKVFNRFMTRFIRFEYQSLVDSFYGLVGQNELTRREAGALAFSTLTRMAAYNMLYDKLQSLVYPAIESAIALVTGEDDLGPREEDDDEWSIETVGQDILRGYVGGALSLVLGRRMGNFGRAVPNFALEYFNREYGEKLNFRSGEYDPYNNSLVFSTIRLQAEGENYMESKLGEDILVRLSGPYSKILKTSIRGAKRSIAAVENKTEEGREKARKEVVQRILPEMVLFTMGAPLAKDIDRLLLREVFEEYNKKEKKKETDRRGGGR